jgi:D-sedoheptulose 7-phosphate isomerase
MDLSFLGMTGSGGGELAQICETIQVPSNRTERIQEMQILLGHTLCLLIEEFLGVFETQRQD